MTNHMTDRINTIFNDRKIRKTFLKLRLPLGIVLLIIVALQLKPGWFLPGLLVSMIGEIVQVWCFSTIKTKKKLTVTGPYMFVRNPMYLGRFFQLFGIIMMTGNPWLMLIFMAVYYFYMVNRVRREEVVLIDLFGKDYQAYCRDVNRYIPGLKRFDAKQLGSFDKESFRENHAMTNIIATLICYVVLYAVTFH